MLIKGMTRAVFAAENEGGAAETQTPEEIANTQIAEAVKAAESGTSLANAGTKEDESAAAAEDDKPVKDAAEDDGAEGEAPKQPADAPDWMKKQLARQHARIQAEKTANEQLRLENEALKKAGQKPKPTGDSAVEVAGEESSDGGRIQRGQFGSQAEFDTAVKQRADQDRAVAEYDRQCGDATASGIKNFGEKEFHGALENLKLAGGFDPDTMQAVLASDEPSKVLFELGRNVDEFTRIMELPTAKRAYEIAKIAMKAAPKKKVSEAPAPVEQVGARGVKVSGVDPTDPLASDKMTDDEFYAKRAKQKADRWAAKQSGRAVA